MSTSQHTLATADPAPHGYYSTADLRDRWRCGRTKLYETIDLAEFPVATVVGRTLLFPRHEVWAWEQSEADSKDGASDAA